MVDRVHIPRHRREDGVIKPGTWFVDWDGLLWHKCPDCKKGGVMGHSVSPAGEVNPSIACWSPCGYHVWGILDGWIYGEKRAEQGVDFTEETCPGHVASASDPKICRRCGEHIDSLRPPDDIALNAEDQTILERE